MIREFLHNKSDHSNQNDDTRQMMTREKMMSDVYEYHFH